jgi:hypothetical protein
MARKPTSKNSSDDFTNVATFYVDQPAAVAYGVHVSKLTFGVSDNDESEFPRPIVTIVIPTTYLLRFVRDISERLEDPEFQENMKTALREALDDFEALHEKP